MLAASRSPPNFSKQHLGQFVSPPACARPLRSRIERGAGGRACHSGNSNRHKISLSQARMRRKLWPRLRGRRWLHSPARTFKVAAPEVTFRLEVSDDGLDGGAAAQLALDDTEDAALRRIKTRREFCASWQRTLVDIGPLDRQPMSVSVRSMTSRKVLPSYGLSGSALACSPNRPPGARRFVGDEAFPPNSKKKKFIRPRGQFSRPFAIRPKQSGVL
jgi:hypothetical protein